MAISELLSRPSLWLVVSSLVLATAGRGDDSLQSLDTSITIERFAGSDLIKHPTGMALTPSGKLLVVESHTHFPPKDYTGPKSDSIVWLEDSDGDGVADQRTVFFSENLKATMDLAVHPESGAIYVATRNEILRLWDRDDDGVADADTIERRLVFFDTKGVYPHNGVSGLTFDPKGDLYFGIGENLGEAYALRGSDGAEISDQGEGGNVFHVDRDGGGLRRFATGFWNPFGVVCTPQGHVFATDNDPSSRPPSRLHYVIDGGDHGYQFRYGRSGQHPFISWDGELPGTLPMLHGSGEAPCDVIELDGNLLVTSWADHRLEVYPMSWEKTHFTTEREILVQGGVDFRPVAFARAPNGDLFVSDWVKRDYELHGEGAVWRLRGWAPEPRPLPDLPAAPTGDEPPSLDDPWQFTRWLRDAPRPGPTDDEPMTAALLLRHRHADTSDPHGAAAHGLDSDDPTVRLLAMKWIADVPLPKHRATVEAIANDPANATDFHGAVTALARFDDQPVDDAAIRRLVSARLLDDHAPASVRRAAFRILPEREAVLSVRELISLFEQSADDEALRIDILLSTLRHQDRKGAVAFAKGAASDQALPERVREFARFVASDGQVSQPPSAEALAGRPALDATDEWLALMISDPEEPPSQDRLDHGRRLFQQHCALCHRAETVGSSGGPDLSQIGAQGREHILRSILEPGAEVAPQYGPWQLTLADGSSYLGFMAGQKGGKHFYTDISGASRTIDNREIVTREQLSVSLMPPGLQNLMTLDDLGSLVDYLASLR